MCRVDVESVLIGIAKTRRVSSGCAFCGVRERLDIILSESEKNLSSQKCHLGEGVVLTNFTFWARMGQGHFERFLGGVSAGVRELFCRQVSSEGPSRGLLCAILPSGVEWMCILRFLSKSGSTWVEREKFRVLWLR